MSLQRCIYLEDDIAKVVKLHKLPLSWFVNQALRKYLEDLKFFEEKND